MPWHSSITLDGILTFLQFECEVGKITERFKYLVKREKRPRGAGDGFKHHPLSVSFHSPSPPVQDISEPLSLSLGVPTYCMVDHEKECIATSSLDLPDTSEFDFAQRT